MKLPEIKSPMGEIYSEIYMNTPRPENRIGLYKSGTRVLPDIAKIEQFNGPPWTSGYLEGIIDVSFLQLTPGTRDGIIYDSNFESFHQSMGPLAEGLTELITEQQKAEEEQASRNILQKVKKALKEAFLLLPREEYNWLNIQSKTRSSMVNTDSITRGITEGAQTTTGETGYTDAMDGLSESTLTENSGTEQKEFFEYSGPLFKTLITPGSTVVGINDTRSIRVIARDKKQAAN